MANERHTEQIRAIRRHFENTLACFQDQDGPFTPKEGLFTVAQHVAHAAQTVEWFFEGAFRPDGFRLDFQELEQDVRAVEELEDAMAWWTSAMEDAEAAIAGSAPEAWDEPIRGDVMGGMPRHTIFTGLADHTAHHRGALAVYARLCGREPAMPYA